MKKEQTEQGFTLIEMSVVVLIIGILAGIALPQYRVAVMKTKVASMLPLMRAWKDAYAMWKLQHGEYYEGGSQEDGLPTAADLGVNWPSDWECDEMETTCHNDEWYCETNSGDNGDVTCSHDALSVHMYQYDEGGSCASYAESFANKIICMPKNDSSLGEKVCKSMGRLAEGCSSDYIIGG